MACISLKLHICAQLLPTAEEAGKLYLTSDIQFSECQVLLIFKCLKEKKKKSKTFGISMFGHSQNLSGHD